MNAARLRLTDLQLQLDHPPEALLQAVCAQLQLTANEVEDISIYRRGYDARKKNNIHLVYTLDIRLAASAYQRISTHLKQASANKSLGKLRPSPDMRYQPVAQAPEGLIERPVIIGAGPCGLFAALILAEMGFRPIILERGKPVRERTKDTWGLWRKGTLQPESNAQFGEGGAGTFSDGKLYSQIRDPNFYSRKVLEEMVQGGAPEEILYISKPHIGTFRLVKVVQYLREKITRLGGEYRFNSRVVDLIIERGQLQGLILADGSQVAARRLILALGHSARDTYQMLHLRGLAMQAKAFSVGYRIEHPQSLIDQARFGKLAGHPLLAAADYKLVHHSKNGRSVYSFCMCPGGTVVAATSEAGHVVTNGMSQYSRNERNANAGIVVGINPSDYDFNLQGQPLVNDNERLHPLAGIAFQRQLEAQAYQLGGGGYFAPAQRVGDFLKNQATRQLGDVIPSYKPGVNLCELGNPQRPSLPLYAIQAIQEAIPAFAQKIKGFDLADAMLTGVETRTSAPVRIERYPENHPQALQSPSVPGIYPAGEGAGYAGGIMSAAIDGIRVAQALALTML